jgi:hypothetical protein
LLDCYTISDLLTLRKRANVHWDIFVPGRTQASLNDFGTLRFVPICFYLDVKVRRLLGSLDVPLDVRHRAN